MPVHRGPTLAPLTVRSTPPLTSTEQPLYRRKAAAQDVAAVEGDLARRIAGGEKLAMGELFDQVGTTLYALALGITHDTIQAEEAVEETFADLWEGRAALNGLVALSPWLVERCRQRAVGLLTDQELPPGMSLGASSGDPLASRLLRCPSRLRRSRVSGALSRLDAREREVVDLAYHHRLGAKEIAGRMGIDMAEVHELLRTGLRGFRAALEGSLRGKAP